MAASEDPSASGLYRTFSYIGSIASATIGSIVFHHKVSDDGLHEIALILIAVSAVVLIMVLADRNLRTASNRSEKEQ
jgi:predicted MFS family arabinose efflux permease